MPPGAGAHVVVTTFEMLMGKNDRPRLSRVEWGYLILDEGHRIKSGQCKLNKQLKCYRTSHRLLLTGTPLQVGSLAFWQRKWT